jgi:hypothetical protein
MNKTLYIRDEDIQIWDRARELAGDKLSPIIVAGLKKFIADKEMEDAESKGFGRIEIPFNDAGAHNIPKLKAFNGKWIYPPDEPIELTSGDGYKSFHYAIAQTAKRNFVFLRWEEESEWKGNYRFQVLPSLEAAAADKDLNSAARQAIKALGVPVEELDI